MSDVTRSREVLERLTRSEPDLSLAIEALVVARRAGSPAELDRALDAVAAAFDDSELTVSALEHLRAQPTLARELVWRAPREPGPRVSAWLAEAGIDWGRVQRTDDRNGKPSQQCILLDGERCGWYRRWERDGRLLEETEYRHGRRHGRSRTYQDGGYVLDQHFVDDRLDGEERRYDRAGNLRHRGQYVQGERTGRWVWWDERQQQIGERDFTGLTLAALQTRARALMPDRDALLRWLWTLEPPLPAGAEAYLTQLLDGPFGEHLAEEGGRAVGWRYEGQRQGVWRIFAPRGGLWRRIEYRDGVAHGRWVEYRDDGTIEVEGQCQGGLAEGLWRRFAPRGRLLAEVVYRNDRPWHGWSLERVPDHRWVEVQLVEGELRWPADAEDVNRGAMLNLPRGLAY